MLKTAIAMPVTRPWACLTAAWMATMSLAGSAAADLRWDTGSGGEFRVYGQFSPTFQSVDDGVRSYDALIDNDHSNSRIGFWYVRPLGQGEFALNVEAQFGLPKTSEISQVNAASGIAWNRGEIRTVDFTYTADWGKVYLGQGFMASDGVVNIDFSNTSLTTYNGVPDTAGAFQFRTAAGALSGIPISAVMPSLDGSRRGRFRYDSPDFNGFTLSFAVGQNILTPGNDDLFRDVALRYARKFSSVEVKGAVAVSRRTLSGVEQEDAFSSFAALFDNGINLAVAGGTRRGGGQYRYVKLGYRSQIFAMGETAVAVDYYDGDDFGLPGRQSSSFGLGVTQQIAAVRTQLYAGYRRYTLRDPGTRYRDIDSVLIGARWKF